MKKDLMEKFCAPHAHDIVRWERGRLVFVASGEMKTGSLIFMFMERLSQVISTQLKKNL